MSRRKRGQAAIQVACGQQPRACRGQSAIEFLMTYGWAILIMLVTLSIILFYNLLGTPAALPRSCYLQPAFPCDAYQLVRYNDTEVNSMGFMLLTHNGLGYDINITSAALYADNLGVVGNHTYLGNCTSTTGSGTLIVKGMDALCIINITDADRIPRTGDSVQFAIGMSYTNCETDPSYHATGSCFAGSNHTIYGNVVTQLENETTAPVPPTPPPPPPTPLKKGWFWGTVTYGNGTPMAYATVTVSNVGSKLTEEDGTYLIQVDAGNYNLTASMSGYADNVTSASISSDEGTEVNPALWLAGWFFGKVSNSTGGGISGATVTASSASGSWANTTDADGNYAIYGLGAGSYSLTASKSGVYSPGFTISTTAGFDAGTKSSTVTITDEYNHTSNALELSFPYADKDSNLVSYWRMENNADDETGRYNGTVTGATSTASGKFGNAYSFNGSVSNYISVPALTTLTTGTPFVLSAWVKPIYTGSYRTIMGYGSTHRLLIGSTGGMLSQQDGNFLSAVGVVPDNVWTHVIYWNNGTTERWYINGNQSGSEHSTVNAEWNAAFKIGQYDLVNYPFKGTIDEVKIYNRALTATEIATLNNSGNEYTTTGDWTSATQAMAAGSKLFNLTLTLANGDASNYVSKIEILNASSSSVLITWTGTMGTTTTLTAADFSNGFNSTAGTDVKVKLYLTGSGSTSISVQQIDSNFDGYNMTTAGISPGAGTEQNFTLAP